MSSHEHCESYYSTKMTCNNWIVIGISGVTCGGKTTLSRSLQERYPNSVVLSQDDYFLPEDSEKHILLPELNHFNWDILTAFDMEKMRSDVDNILNTQTKEKRLLIIEGVLILNDEYIAKLCDKKYFITLPYNACQERRGKRTYNPPDVPGYFEKCAWPEYLKSKDIAFNMNQDLNVIDGELDNEITLGKIEKDIKVAFNFFN